MSHIFRIARIPKGRGRFREVYVLAQNAQDALRELLPELLQAQRQVQKADVSYAFLPERNCALMALQHTGKHFTLSLDLENFFESVTIAHVDDLVKPHIVTQCFVEGRLRQGFATSPLLSDIAFAKVDAAILTVLNRIEPDTVYTRYADDLVFSFDQAQTAGKLLTVIRQVVERFGFKVNERKTQVQSARNGRRIITGIAVDSRGIHTTRQTRRKLRAALHQENASSAQGLAEWAKCKLPGAFFEPTISR